MRDGRLPLWEEPANQNGGTWRLKCHKCDTARVWKEVVLAAIGEQFMDSVTDGDEICGVTVSIRDRDDLIQIWNVNAALASGATVPQKVHRLLPDVIFPAEFYKPHQSHHAYGRHWFVISGIVESIDRTSDQQILHTRFYKSQIRNESLEFHFIACAFLRKSGISVIFKGTPSKVRNS